MGMLFRCLGFVASFVPSYHVTHLINFVIDNSAEIAGAQDQTAKQTLGIL